MPYSAPSGGTQFAHDGLMSRREASINDVVIAASDLRINGTRPSAERGLVLALA